MRPFELVVPRSLAEASSIAGKGVVYKAAGIDLLDRLTREPPGAGCPLAAPLPGWRERRGCKHPLP